MKGVWLLRVRSHLPALRILRPECGAWQELVDIDYNMDLEKCLALPYIAADF